MDNKIYFQPDFGDDLDLVTPDGQELWSYHVYSSYENAKKDFPDRKIIAYSGDDIENPYFIDAEEDEKPPRKIKVALEFHYEEGEDVTHYPIGDCAVKEIRSLHDAIDVARAEIENSAIGEFIFKAYYRDDPARKVKS